MLLGLQALDLPLPADFDGNPISADEPEKIRATLKKKLAIRAAAIVNDDEEAYDQLNRLVRSLGKQECPYEEVAFFLAPMCGVTLNFIAGESSTGVQISRFEVEGIAGGWLQALSY